MHVTACSASSNRLRLVYENRTGFNMMYEYCKPSRIEGMLFSSEYQFHIDFKARGKMSKISAHLKVGCESYQHR